VRDDRDLDEAMSGQRPLLALALLLLGAAPLRGQKPRGRIEGEIIDSVHARKLVGALVMATRVAPEPAQSFGTLTDDAGRFRFDTLAAGRYQLSFVVPFLDSIAVVLPPRDVVLADGEQLRVDMATPPGAAFREAACPGTPPGRGAVVGEVVDADTDRPVSGARLAVVWAELSVERASLRVESTRRTEAVTTDSLGRFWLCGVPTGTALFAQVQHEQVVGAVIELVVDDSLGIVRRSLSLSRAEARRNVDTVVVAGADTVPPRPLTGTATLTGLVLSPGGLPLGGAHVRVVDTAPVSVTDSLGRFTLQRLPAGSQVAEVRKLGYPRARTLVELRPGRAASITVQLSRVVSLDSVLVLAQRTRYGEFEERRRSNAWGRFLDQTEIAKRNAFDTSDLLRMMPGMQVRGNGNDAIVVSGRGPDSPFGGPCIVNVVIDGMSNMDINMVSPRDIGAMEVYSGPSTVPPQYASFSSCGAVIIWTKR
jgi:hypothetical protein